MIFFITNRGQPDLRGYVGSVILNSIFFKVGKSQASKQYNQLKKGATYGESISKL